MYLINVMFLTWETWSTSLLTSYYQTPDKVVFFLNKNVLIFFLLLCENIHVCCVSSIASVIRAD